MKIYRAKIQWVDSPEVHEMLICDQEYFWWLEEGTESSDPVLVPSPYRDSDIFFYGLSGDDLNELIETQDIKEDFRVKEFWIEWESEDVKD